MYQPVDERFWDDLALRSVSERARFLACYLLTNPNVGVLAVAHRFDPDVASVRTGIPRAAIESAADELSRIDFSRIDFLAGVALIPNAWKFRPCKSDTQALGLPSRLRELPACRLTADAHVLTIAELKFQRSRAAKQLRSTFSRVIRLTTTSLKNVLKSVDSKEEINRIPYRKGIDTQKQEHVSVPVSVAGGSSGGAVFAVAEKDEKFDRSVGRSEPVIDLKISRLALVKPPAPTPAIPPQLAPDAKAPQPPPSPTHATPEPAQWPLARWWAWAKRLEQPSASPSLQAATIEADWAAMLAAHPVEIHKRAYVAFLNNATKPFLANYMRKSQWQAWCQSILDGDAAKVPCAKCHDPETDAFPVLIGRGYDFCRDCEARFDPFLAAAPEDADIDDVVQAYLRADE